MFRVCKKRSASSAHLFFGPLFIHVRHGYALNEDILTSVRVVRTSSEETTEDSWLAAAITRPTSVHLVNVPVWSSWCRDRVLYGALNSCACMGLSLTLYWESIIKCLAVTKFCTVKPACAACMQCMHNYGCDKLARNTCCIIMET